MSPAKVLRFSDAAYAIGKAPSTLRNWLARNQVKLPGTHSEGWREFTWSDIAVLALVSELVSFGFRVEAASQVGEHLQRGFPDVFGNRINHPDTMLQMWGESVARVWPEEDRFGVAVLPLFNATRAKTTNSRDQPVFAYITLDISRILARAFARASESNSDGAST